LPIVTALPPGLKRAWLCFRWAMALRAPSVLLSRRPSDSEGDP
jgi:hypothetical protein